MTELIWEGKPSLVHVHSGGYEYGCVTRHLGRETIDNKDGTLTRNELFDTILSEFQDDIMVFDDKDYKICEIESTCEYYDYDAHFENVIKMERSSTGTLYITVRRLGETPIKVKEDEN